MSRFDPDLPRHLLDARHGLAGGASFFEDDDLRIPPPPARPEPRPRPPSALRCVMRDFACGLLLAWATVEVVLWFGGA